MNTPGSRKLVTLLPLLLALAWVVGCMSYQAVPDSEWPRIANGDELRVTMRAGPVHELEVQDRDAETLRGAEIELLFADLLRIERNEETLSAGRWFLVLAGTILFFAGLASFFD